MINKKYPLNKNKMPVRHKLVKSNYFDDFVKIGKVIVELIEFIVPQITSMN
jgi:hypothetical protein